jgi:hypothetical protein
MGRGFEVVKGGGDHDECEARISDLEAEVKRLKRQLSQRGQPVTHESPRSLSDFSHLPAQDRAWFERKIGKGKK